MIPAPELFSAMAPSRVDELLTRIRVRRVQHIVLMAWLPRRARRALTLLCLVEDGEVPPSLTGDDVELDALVCRLSHAAQVARNGAFRARGVCVHCGGTGRVVHARPSVRTCTCLVPGELDG